MTGISINIGIDDANIRAALLGLKKRSEDMFPLMDEIGGIVVADVQHNFESGTAPDGTPWKKSKRVINKGGQTLVLDNYLQNSITHDPSSDQVAIGTNLVYAGIHQMGGKTGRNHAVNMPARPFLGVSAGAETEILDAAREYMAAPFEGGRT